MKYDVVARNIRQDLKMYLQAFSNLKSLVIGVSGGIDSAICCALARPVCDEMGVKLIGRSLPMASNKADEIHRANRIGETFCHDYKEVQLGFNDTYHALNILEDKVVDNVESTKDKAIRLGNIKARMRMIFLYDLAQQNKGMVLSTDNYTELMLSYFTLHGDVGDYGMIQNIYKTEVYELATFIANDECGDIGADALMACVYATPTDGLGITDSDLEQIGANSYEEVDEVLRCHFNDNSKYTDHPVIIRHHKTSFKRTNPYNIERNIVIKNA
jgi:NAD+ synthase